jgi:aldehyde:ferredoxin oxidoreductase
MMFYGWAGNILRIDLSKGKIVKQPLPEQLARDFVGGRGIGAKILFDELKPGTDPLSAKNILIAAVGPLTGTPIPTSRCTFVTKSPLTQAYICSFMGGFFPAELRFAGYDVLIISGKARKPVYIWIKDDDVEIRDAKEFWGMQTDEAEEKIRQKTDPKARVACIGPAGENLVKYACVVADRRAAGRGGVGTVMASKKLKAIAVRGSERVNIADPEAFQKTRKDLFKEVTSVPQMLSKYGSSGVVSIMNEFGVLPTRNFITGVFEGAEQISGESLDKFTVKKDSCFGCPLGCGQFRVVNDGPYAGVNTVGPEYETVFMFGSHCGNSSPEAIIAADSLCDKLGLDTMSTGYAVGFAMDLYERGILSKKEVDGLDLRFGNHQAMMDMIRKIAFKEGVGKVLAEGAFNAAKKIGRGSEKYVMAVKGLEMPGYDPRGLKGHGLSIATSNRGACHNRGYATQETRSWPWPEDRFGVEGKGKLAVINQDRSCIIDYAGWCLFFAFRVNFEVYTARFLPAVTGVEDYKSVEELLKIGERINNVERAFNVREGFTRKDDMFPERFLKEPMPEGNSKGQIFEMEPMLDEYYKTRGWDLKTGIPKREKLEELGLHDVAKELQMLGKLPTYART